MYRLEPSSNNFDIDICCEIRNNLPKVLVVACCLLKKLNKRKKFHKSINTFIERKVYCYIISDGFVTFYMQSEVYPTPWTRIGLYFPEVEPPPL